MATSAREKSIMEELASQKGRSKSALGLQGTGFPCEACNMVFKDSLTYLDHCNGRARKFFPNPIHYSPSDQLATGKTAVIEVATDAQVKEKLQGQKRKHDQIKSYDLEARVQERLVEEALAREKRKQEKKERKRAAKYGNKRIKLAEDESETPNSNASSSTEGPKPSTETSTTAEPIAFDLAAMGLPTSFGTSKKNR